VHTLQLCVCASACVVSDLIASDLMTCALHGWCAMLAPCIFSQAGSRQFNTGVVASRPGQVVVSGTLYTLPLPQATLLLAACCVASSSKQALHLMPCYALLCV
jgi:hypothetical protein